MSMIVETHCSICGKKLGGKDARKETRVGIFEPHFHKGEISHFAMGDNRLALCKSCTQSLYSWIKNRRVRCLKKSIGYGKGLYYDVTPVGPGDCACVEEQLGNKDNISRMPFSYHIGPDGRIVSKV